MSSSDDIAPFCALFIERVSLISVSVFLTSDSDSLISPKASRTKKKTPPTSNAPIKMETPDNAASTRFGFVLQRLRSRESRAFERATNIRHLSS